MGLKPVGIFFGRVGAQGIGDDAPPSQVEPVRIPAGQDGDVAGDQAVAVVRACVAQQAHFGRRRLKIPAPELPGEFGAAFSVPGIGMLVDSPGVVEKRNSSMTC